MIVLATMDLFHVAADLVDAFANVVHYAQVFAVAGDPAGVVGFMSAARVAFESEKQRETARDGRCAGTAEHGRPILHAATSRR